MRSEISSGGASVSRDRARDQRRELAFFGLAPPPHSGFLLSPASSGSIPMDDLSVERLVEAIEFITSRPAQDAARRLSEQIRAEVRLQPSTPPALPDQVNDVRPLLFQNGVAEGASSFYSHLPLLGMRLDRFLH